MKQAVTITSGQWRELADATSDSQPTNKYIYGTSGYIYWAPGGSLLEETVLILNATVLFGVFPNYMEWVGGLVFP